MDSSFRTVALRGTTSPVDDESFADDDLFDDVQEAQLAKMEQYSDDGLFDDIDEGLLEELERPTKRIKTESEPVCIKIEDSDDELPPNRATHNSEHLELAERLLKEKFGYKSFRHEQAGAIQSILAGDNTLVDALLKRRIPAESIDSTKSWYQLQETYASLRQSRLRIVYVAPERLNNEGFVETIKFVPGGIRLLAVDEAHCVSEWGHSFRPDYLKVARFAQEVNAERVVCLTATATLRVADDIAKAFNIKPSAIFRTSPYRPNLSLCAQTIDDCDLSSMGISSEIMRQLIPELPANESEERFTELFRFLHTHPGPTLVYVALQQQAEDTADALIRRGFSAAAFHSGMKTQDKLRIQEDFMADRIRIVCATIAFGMGIDKPDIRNVVNWDLANSLEEYSQQIGRAGRDGQPSTCMFYLAPSAFYLREVFARGDVPSRISIENLMADIAALPRGKSVGDIISVSQWSQSREFDIRPTRLGVIYATLELTFGLLRASTPEYTTYKYTATEKYDRALADRSPEAKAIFSVARKLVKFYDVDINGAAHAAGLMRVDLIRKINEFNDRGYIVLQTSGVLQRYIILKPIPRTKNELAKFTDKLYADSLSKEKDALERCQAVMDLITGSKCFALALTEHFGMGLPDNKSSCGHCTWCQTGEPVESPKKPRLYRATAKTIAPVLKAVGVRDDPRFLTRVAWGIKSPRTTQLKLDKSKVFRSLSYYDFDDLLREFTKACSVKR